MKGKHCYEKGSGHRLSKTEFNKHEKKYQQEHKEKPTIGSSEPDPIRSLMPIISHYQEQKHRWTYKGVDINLPLYKCAKCGKEPDHMFTRTLLDVDWENMTKEQKDVIEEKLIEDNNDLIEWTKERLDKCNWKYDGCWTVNNMSPEEFLKEEENRTEKLINNVKWIYIYFVCKEDLSHLFNVSFCPGGRLSNHFYRVDKNRWIHFKDVYLIDGEIPEPLPEHEFTMDISNYKKVLRSKSNILLGKRNFCFYYLPCASQRKTGFCPYCEANIPYPDANDTPDCPHPKEWHYIDEEWNKKYTGWQSITYFQKVKDLMQHQNLSSVESI